MVRLENQWLGGTLLTVVHGRPSYRQSELIFPIVSKLFEVNVTFTINLRCLGIITFIFKSSAFWKKRNVSILNTSTSKGLQYQIANIQCNFSTEATLELWSLSWDHSIFTLNRTSHRNSVFSRYARAIGDEFFLSPSNYCGFNFDSNRSRNRWIGRCNYYQEHLLHHYVVFM